MSWLEVKYVSLLSSRLKNYKRKSGNLFNMSCPFCDDLKAHPYQGRGYIYEKKGNLSYFCHYCNKTMSAASFIHAVDQALFDEYNMEKLKESKPSKQQDLEEFVSKMKKPVFLKSGPLKNLKKISQLEHYDPLKIFIQDRKIPTPYHAKLFACPNFYSWVNSFIPNKFSEKTLKNDERKIVIPFFDKEKNLHSLQGRTLNSKSKVKYITIVIDENKPKLYGLDTVVENKDIYVHEGPFDSMFIPNSIASAGGDLVSAVKTLPKEKCIICLDNEPRSRETKQKIQKAITNGYRVCIWPDNFEYKDINEAVVAGVDPAYIENMINKNVYQGLEANLKLATWSKI